MASRNKRGKKETGTMTRRFIRECMPVLALAGAILLSLPPRADALLQAAVSIDGGASLLACDNVAAGGACVGGLAAFSDTDPALGVLRTDATSNLGGVVGLNAEVAIQTAVKGGLNTLSSSGTVIANTTAAEHEILLTISETGFFGPSFQFTATGSGTWVDQTDPIAYGNSAITMEWWNDPANAQGATAVGVTPGNLVFGPQSDDPVDGISNQSFSFNSGLSPLAIPDLGDFSMSLDNTLVLGPGIRLESRGQAESKPQLLQVPAPSTLLLLGSALVLLGWRRRGSAA
jgi:PEP-CTERM motif